MKINFAELLKSPALYAFLGYLVQKIGAAATGSVSWKSIIMDIVISVGGLLLTNSHANNTAALKKAGLMKP